MIAQEDRPPIDPPKHDVVRRPSGVEASDPSQFRSPAGPGLGSGSAILAEFRERGLASPPSQKT
jgi:hypothetical protein